MTAQLVAQLAALIIAALALLLLVIIAVMVFEPDAPEPLRDRWTAYVYLVPVATSQRPVYWQPTHRVGNP